MASTLGAKGVSEAGKESKWCLVVHGGRHVACRPRKTPMYWTVGGKKQEAGETVGGKKGWRWERENCCLGRAHMCDSVREKREKERERERGRAAVVKLWCSSAPPKQLRWSSLLCSFTWLSYSWAACCAIGSSDTRSTSHQVGNRTLRATS
jgi:hypothetical protein